MAKLSPTYRTLSLLVCLGITLALTQSALAQTLFSEDWDDGQASTRWSSPLEFKESSTLTFDGAADYAFDYGLLGIPAAPNSAMSSKIGLFLEANTTDQTLDDEGESIGVLPLGLTLPSTNYSIRADLYLIVNDEIGTTEYATLGTHHQGSNDLPHRFGLNQGDGLAWQISSDGGSSTDLLRYESVVGSTEQEVSLGDWESISNGLISNVPTGNALNIGPQNQWVEIEILSVAGQTEFLVNGFVIDSYDNSTENFNAGTLLLAHSDPFNSVNVDNGLGISNGAIFDNVIVTVIPEPLAGDYNGDGFVNAADYTIWRDSFGSVVPHSTGADGDKDGTIGNGDYSVWVNHYGKVASNNESLSQSTPEPSSLLMVCSFLILGLTSHPNSTRLL